MREPSTGACCRGTQRTRHALNGSADTLFQTHWRQKLYRGRDGDLQHIAREVVNSHGNLLAARCSKHCQRIASAADAGTPRPKFLGITHRRSRSKCVKGLGIHVACDHVHEQRRRCSARTAISMKAPQELQDRRHRLPDELRRALDVQVEAEDVEDCRSRQHRHDSAERCSSRRGRHHQAWRSPRSAGVQSEQPPPRCPQAARFHEQVKCISGHVVEGLSSFRLFEGHNAISGACSVLAGQPS